MAEEYVNKNYFDAKFDAVNNKIDGVINQVNLRTRS